MPQLKPIQVPRAAHSDVQVLLSAPVVDLDALATVVGTLGPQQDVENIGAEAARRTPLSEDAANSILTLCLHVSRISREFDLSPRQALDGVLESLERVPSWTDDLSLLWNERAEALSSIIHPDGVIDVMSKARELRYESQCVHLSSTIITDLRLIYDTDATNTVGGLILHTLALRYVDGVDDDRTIHVALSSFDIDDLISRLERARKKEQVALRHLEAMGLPELTPRME